VSNCDRNKHFKFTLIPDLLNFGQLFEAHDFDRRDSRWLEWPSAGQPGERGAGVETIRFHEHRVMIPQPSTPRKNGYPKLRRGNDRADSLHLASAGDRLSAARDPRAVDTAHRPRSQRGNMRGTFSK